MRKLSMASKMYHCNTCGEKCENSSELRNHVSNIHEEFNCIEAKCDFKAIGRSYLKYHMKEKHKP